MTTSNYMPDVSVQIAFNAGARTPLADYVWTDVSAKVEFESGFTITGGRQNERSVADANQLTGLVLDNTEGDFTADRVTGAHYPYVKLDRPIQVLDTPVDGAETVRFRGFINEWPTEWDGTDTYSKATISASSRLSRLGYTAGLRSIVEETILADGPAAYYPLGEPAGAMQAADMSGNGADPLTLAGDPALPVVFGTATGPGTDSLTAAQFAGEQYLRGSVTVGGSGVTLEVAFLRDGVPSVDEGLLRLGPVSLVIGIASGQIYATNATTPGVVFTSANAVTDNAVHVATLTMSSGGTWTLYIDGVSVGTGAGGALTAGSYDLLVGQGAIAFFFVDRGFRGVLAHVGVYSSVLTGTQAAAHAASMLTGFSGDTTDARLVRYAALAGIPSAEVDAETGSTTVSHVDTTDKQAVDLMRLMETTEGGVLYDERDGTLTLHNRAHRYTATSAFTLDMLKHMVEADYSPQLDRTYILNDASAANLDGTYRARAKDDTSLADYGPMTASVETASLDDDEPLQLASWLVYQYKQPRVRVASCTVDVLAQVGKTPNSAAVLAATVGTKVTISNHPQQASFAQVDYFVEGWTETYGPESCRITFNLSPAAPYADVLIVGDASRGVVGTNPVAY